VSTPLASSAGRLARSCLSAGLAVGLVLAAPAHAQEPTPVAKAAAKADPSVAFVATTVVTAVRLTIDNPYAISGREAFSGRSRLYASGSGFLVNPKGILVTAKHVVRPQGSEIRTHAANQLFFDRAGFRPADGSDDDFARHHIDDPYVDQLLQQCYDGVACEFSTRTDVEVLTPVQLAGTTAAKPLKAQVLKSTGSDIAILQVDGANMPTAPLAASAKGLQTGQMITALGFPGSAQDLPTGVTEPTKLFGRVSTVRPDDSGQTIQVDMNLEGGMSGSAVLDDTGKVIGLVSYTGIEGGSRTQGYLRTVDDIRSALRAAGVQAERGELDTIFAQAMDHYWNRHYSAALPLYQKVLNLYDGHPLAKRYLALAQAKAGGPEDVPLPSSRVATSGRPAMWVLGLAALAVLAAVLVLLVLARRRRGARRPPARPAPPPWGAASQHGAEPDGQRFLRQAGIGNSQPMDGPSASSGSGTVTAASPVAVDTLTEAAEQDDVAAIDDPVPVRQFCTYCGGRVAPENQFCGSCGRRL
jgi:S1-C subfamily serine protease